MAEAYKLACTASVLIVLSTPVNSHTLNNGVIETESLLSTISPPQLPYEINGPTAEPEGPTAPLITNVGSNLIFNTPPTMDNITEGSNSVLIQEPPDPHMGDSWSGKNYPE